MMDALYAALFAWAITLSGYPAAPAPSVVTAPVEALQAMACGGSKCPIYGWFPPGQTVFLNDALNLENSKFSESILVHEYVHYLQQQSGKFPRPWTCEVSMAMEVEAYAVQRQFLARHGIYRPVGVTRRGCNDS